MVLKMWREPRVLLWPEFQIALDLGCDHPRPAKEEFRNPPTPTPGLSPTQPAALHAWQCIHCLGVRMLLKEKKAEGSDSVRVPAKPLFRTIRYLETLKRWPTVNDETKTRLLFQL